MTATKATDYGLEDALAPGVYVVHPAQIGGMQAAIPWKGGAIELKRWPVGESGFLPGLCSEPVEGRVFRTEEFPEVEAKQMLRAA